MTTPTPFFPRLARVLLALCGAALLVPAFAQVPRWYQFTDAIPVEDGEFYVPGGTNGSLSIAIADNGVVGGAVYFYTPTGELVAQAISGSLVRNDDDIVRETGEIAYVDLETYALSDGPCRGCPYSDRTQVRTSDVTRLVWTAPRIIEFTVNGVTETAVGLVSGPPLVAPTDFSGTWLLVARTDYGDLSLEGPVGLHGELVVAVTLAPFTPVQEFFILPDGTYDDVGLVFNTPDPAVLPPAGARFYSVTCASPECNLTPMFDSALYAAATSYVIWMDAGNQGRLLPLRGYGVVDNLIEVPRLYASGGDRIVGHGRDYRGEPFHGLVELALTRLPYGFDGRWTLLPCFDGGSERIRPAPCNSFTP